MSSSARAPAVVTAAYLASLPSLRGKAVAVTGCTSGTGLVLARAAAARGARVVLLNRPSPRADAALAAVAAAAAAAGAPAPLSVPCDLASFASVRAAAARLDEELAGGLDVLCNNAGIMAVADERTEDGFEVQMQANHLSHFLLTHSLFPLLAAAARARGEARVVNHTSGARNRAPIARPLDAAYLSRSPAGSLGGGDTVFCFLTGAAKWVRYQQSKLANALFTYASAERAPKACGVKFLLAHPGPTATGLQEKVAQGGFLDRTVISAALKAAHSSEDGAHGILRACFEPGAQSGAFFGPAGVGKAGPAVELPSAPERNAEGERLLWERSLEATGARPWGGVPVKPRAASALWGVQINHDALPPAGCCCCSGGGGGGGGGGGNGCAAAACCMPASGLRSTRTVASPGGGGGSRSLCPPPLSPPSASSTSRSKGGGAKPAARPTVRCTCGVLSGVSMALSSPLRLCAARPMLLRSGGSAAAAGEACAPALPPKHAASTARRREAQVGGGGGSCIEKEAKALRCSAECVAAFACARCAACAREAACAACSAATSARSADSSARSSACA